MGGNLKSSDNKNKAGQKSRKSPVSSRKKTSVKRRAKKPKVLLSSKKVYTMTACIVVLCCGFLYLSVSLNSFSEKNKQVVATVQKNEAADFQTEKNQGRKVPAPVKPQIHSAPAKTAEKAAPLKKETSLAAASEAAGTAGTFHERSSVKMESKKTEVKKSAVSSAASAVKDNVASSAASGKNTVKKTGKVAAVIPPSDKSQEEALKFSRFQIEKARNGATVVLIIDDAGHSVSNTRRYASLPFPLTIAVLPGLPQTKQCAQAVREGGKELILHQPMQAENLSINPGPGAIRSEMNSWEIAAVVKRNLDELGFGVKGMNNHEGSLITANEIKIGTVLDVCAERNVYFLDSRTTAATKAHQAALERNMSIFEKAGPYIDNEVSREKMLERMYETLRYASNHGRAIVIAHVDKSAEILPDLLNEMYPYMKAAGYRFATPSQLR